MFSHTRDLINKDGEYVILEPCVGESAILQVLQHRFQKSRFITADINSEHDPDWNADMTLKHSWESLFANTERPDWTITNPPFSTAIHILENAYEYSKIGVVMLLRLTFLEPTKKRMTFLQKHPPNKMIIFGQPRPSFTNNGETDSVTTAWFIWTKDGVYHPMTFAPKWKKQ